MNLPRPPPPYAALKITGSPCFMQNSIASSEVVTGPSVPGTMGTPASIAACLAATYRLDIHTILLTSGSRIFGELRVFAKSMIWNVGESTIKIPYLPFAEQL